MVQVSANDSSTEQTRYFVTRVSLRAKGYFIMRIISIARQVLSMIVMNTSSIEKKLIDTSKCHKA
jgi:hypothetical protein